MGELVDLIDKIKRYFRFTPSELKGFIISILVIAFIISFREWGGKAFDVKAGSFNFFNAILIVALSMLFHISIQKIWSLGTGYVLEYKMWGLGLGFGLILAFITNGRFWLILPGGFIVHHLAGHRLGWFRYDINYWALGLIAAGGVWASALFAVFFKAISAITFNALIQKAIIFNVVYAVYSVLPIPPLDGSKTYFGSRMLYAFNVSSVVAAAILLVSNIPVFIAVASSLLIGIILWLLYYVLYEKDYWPY